MEWPGKDPADRTEFERMPCNYGLIELLGISVKEGRPFSPDFPADSNAIIFNEAGIAFMGMEDPIGKKVKLWGTEREIVGVVKDFNFESLHQPVKPLFFFLSKESSGTLFVRLESGREAEVIPAIEKVYKSFNPGYEMSYRFLEQGFQRMYDAERKVATLSRYFAGLAILISCLGLLGLAAFTAERRVKEIAIRKTLGASKSGIIFLLSYEFTQMVVVAIVVAVPLSWYATSQWLLGFRFHMELSWWIFAGSGAAALLIAWLTVGFQTLRAAGVNPAQSLKSE